MAILRMEFYSQSLRRITNFEAIIPADNCEDKERPYEPWKPEKYKTLYLLHGIYGNGNEWVTGTRVRRWAEEKKLAVIIPDGDNKFYVDNPRMGECYSRYIGDELVTFTRNVLPLSDKREDTFISGLSMGGYGALVNGLKFNHVFSKIAPLSAGLILDMVDKAEYSEEWNLYNRYYYEGIFGDLDKVRGSDKDYYALAKKVADSGTDIPDIYMAVGKDDWLLAPNQAYDKYLTEIGLPHTFEVGEGQHDWDFWDPYIKKVIDWAGAVRG